VLSLLRDYARRHGVDSEPGFSRRYAKWAIVCDADGRYLHSVRLGDASQKNDPGREFPVCPELSQPELVRGSEVRSQFLIEKADVVACVSRNPGAKERAKHDFFLCLLRQASEVMPELRAAAKCLGDGQQLEAIRTDLEEQKCTSTDNVTIQIAGRFPVESSAWHDWWREFREQLAASAGGATKAKGSTGRMRCFVTGDLVIPVATHPKIQGLASVGGSTMGSSLIGFDKDAYCSYGLKQSANAAVSETSAAAYRAGLNHLLRHNSRILVGAKVAHWYKDSLSDEEDPLSWLTEDEELVELDAGRRADQLLRAIRTGERPNLAGNRYYAITVSGAAGRTMIRDWMEGPFEELLGNVQAWFTDLALVAPDGNGLLPEPRISTLLAASARRLEDCSAPLAAMMWRAAVCNEMIPPSAMAGALQQWHSELLRGGRSNCYRVALMKAYQLRWARRKEGMTMTELQTHLNEAHSDASYHCGRLMAILAAVQRAALGDVGAGVVQRYYAAASSTPALVLGRLTRTSQFHLGKMEKGLAYWYEGHLSSIWSAIGDELPTALSLEQQSVFALGYYQQMADLRTKRNAAAPEEAEVSE
jgi:CRISPR-associated protein Csd1